MGYTSEIKRGSILVSTPLSKFNNPLYENSIILITNHGENGSIGFVLNKPTDINIADATEDFNEFDSKIYAGGILKLQDLYYIHTIGTELDGSEKIMGDLFFGGDFYQLKAMIADGFVKTQEIRFYAGYTCWGPNQLKKEIENKNWITTKLNKDLILSERPKILWQNIIKKMGPKDVIENNYLKDCGLN